jgi:hypothetical protein
MSRTIYATALLAALLLGCSKPDPEQVEFQKKFDHEAILVKTCRPDPSIESGPSLKVYRFQEQLWFNDRGIMRRVDAKVDDVCELLDEPKKRP